jgi:hypothetical protein
MGLTTIVGKDLEKKIPISNTDPLQYINNDMMSSLYLQLVEYNELKCIITSLKNSSSGYDGIHAKIVKQTFNLFLEPLKYVCNMSLSQGFFPNEMKVAKVVPLYKNGDVKKFNNYRPVSILPLFSKTSMALMTLVDMIMSAIDEGDLVVGVFLDFQKAFDTIKHEILLRKLHKYGI